MALSILLQPLVGIPVLLVLVLARLAYWFCYDKERDAELARIPGPTIEKWTILWLVQSLATGKAVEDFLRLDKKYGR
jgi:hypothetical protein